MVPRPRRAWSRPSGGCARPSIACRSGPARGTTWAPGPTWFESWLEHPRPGRPVLGAAAVRGGTGADLGPDPDRRRLAGPVHRAEPRAVPDAGRPGRPHPAGRRPLDSSGRRQPRAPRRSPRAWPGWSVTPAPAGRRPVRMRAARTAAVAARTAAPGQSTRCASGSAARAPGCGANSAAGRRPGRTEQRWYLGAARFAGYPGTGTGGPRRSASATTPPIRRRRQAARCWPCKPAVAATTGPWSSGWTCWCSAARRWTRRSTSSARWPRSCRSPGTTPTPTCSCDCATWIRSGHSRNVCDGIVRLTADDPLTGPTRVSLLGAAHRFGPRAPDKAPGHWRSPPAVRPQPREPARSTRPPRTCCPPTTTSAWPPGSPRC